MKNGTTAEELGREIGASEATIYNWRKKYRNMTINEAKRRRELEAENSNLKKLVADLSLDIVILKDVNSRKW